jgi:hypothetical protein
MQLLKAAIVREYRLKLAISVGMALAGGLVGILYLGRWPFVSGAGFVAGLAGFLLAYLVAFRQRPVDHRLLYLLRGAGAGRREIVWIYSVRTQTMPFGLYLWERGTMYFKLLDGSEIVLSLPADQLKMVSKFLGRLLPHAAIGYSKERMEQYERGSRRLSGEGQDDA